jgi:hypothetical protein
MADRTLAQMIEKEREIERDLHEIRKSISTIRKECKHENTRVSDRYQDPGSGRTCYDYTCEDCGHWW